MKTTLAQIKFKIADFNFNYEQIAKVLNAVSADLVIFPQCDITDIGSFANDELIINAQNTFYNKLATSFSNKTFLLGGLLFQNGRITDISQKHFQLCNQDIYADDTYRENVVCDLYILSKNKYFVTENDFIENINTNRNLIYINAIGLADCNVFAGESFVKNSKNELIVKLPLCEEKVSDIDFSAKSISAAKECREKQILKILTFALKEYCENTGFKKVLLGLSGGMDSALVAVLAQMALGAENVLGVLMPSMYSSDGSVTDSIALANNLRIKTIKHSISPLFENFMDKLGFAKAMDLAEENLQARLRALILMFISNRENRLLLSTSNKSESAMGFGTLYGDLAGGLNLICDLTKTNVYKLANYINKEKEIIPQAIIDKPPSAELRPNQKDQDRLPEYEILDGIIEMFLEKNCPREEIYAKYGKDLTEEVIKKIYRYQFKRKQTCLGIRLTERSFASGVDLPIIQGFY